MYDVSVIECTSHTEKLIDYFNGHLRAVGLKKNLEQIHEVFEFKGDKNNIAEISCSSACDILYLGIPNSKNFKFINFSHNEFLKENSFNKIYKSLLEFIFEKLEICKDEYYVQKIPTLRVQQPNLNTSLIWHIDSQFGHPENEINIWLPLTKLSESSTLWFENNGIEFKSNVDINSCLVFPWNLRHGTKINKTSFSRVSIDFRLISIENFEKFLNKKTNSTSIARNLSFENDYYKKYDSKF